MTIGSHKDTKGTAAISGQIEGKGKIHSPHISPIPCLRRVPFDTTKRNQKSPLGAGPSICIARIWVAHDLPCQPRKSVDALRVLSKGIPFVLTTKLPNIPGCLRRVPFDTTKRNQKSPLGAGPSICIARIASRVAPDLLPCQPRRNIGPRRWTETHALL